MKDFICCLLFLMFFLLPVDVFALQLTEIYPAPGSEQHEWVELYNNSDQAVITSDYIVSDDKNKNLKLETTSIEPFGFALATSANILNNGGDTVLLKNTSGEVLEQITYPAGITSTQSYARCSDMLESWILTDSISQKAPNNVVCTQPTLNQSSSITGSPPPTDSNSSVMIENVVISEVMPHPTDNGSEWVELYNKNSYEVALSEWYIDDVENAGSSPRRFSITISPLGFATIDISSAMFNNSGDTVRLLDNQMNVKDILYYEDSTSGYSFGKTADDSNTVCLQSPTKNAVNGSCLSLSTSPTSVLKTTITNQPMLKSSLYPSSPITSKKTAIARSMSTLSYDSYPTGSQVFISPLISPDSQVLGIVDSSEISYIDRLRLVKALASSGYFISLINIAYLLHKIIKKRKEAFI